MRRGNKKPFVLLIIISILAGFSPSVYTLSTGKEVESYEEVTFGDISPTSTLLTEAEYVSQKAIADINAYMEENGYNYRFDVVLENAAESSSVHLEKIKAFKSMGINLVIGGKWSSMAQDSLSYVNSNDMLLISPTSKSPLLSNINDNLFRVSPTDSDAGKILSEMIARYGLQAVTVIQRDEYWADKLYDTFSEDFDRRGGVVVERIKYSIESDDYYSVIEQADDAVYQAIEDYGYENVGVLILSLEEASSLAYYAFDFFNVSTVPWFGWTINDAYGGYGASVIEDVPYEASILGLYSPMIVPFYGNTFWSMRDSLVSKLGYEPNFYTAASYDTYWLLALAVLEAGSSDAASVKRALPIVADGYVGVSGDCSFDEYGDRLNANYAIWGLEYNNSAKWEYFGYYNSSHQRIYWPLDHISVDTQPYYHVYTPLTGFHDNPVRFRLSVSGDSEQSLSRVSVNIFIDDIFQESLVTDNKGEVSSSYTLDAGEHTWYAEIVVNEVIYKTEEYTFSVDRLYDLKVISEYGVTTGSGSYPGGETVSFSVSPTEFNIDSGERVTFSEWTCYSDHGYIGKDNPASLVISDHTNEIAVWKTQYYVDVVEGDGYVYWGGGWHNQGERIELKAEKSSGLLIRTVFDGWSGDHNSPNNPTYIIITKPVTVYANWRTDYTNLILVAAVCVAGVLVLWYRSRSKEKSKKKIEDEYKRERDYIQELINSGSIIDIKALMRKYSLREERAKELLNQTINDRNLIGFYSSDGMKFVKMVHVRRSIRQRLDLPH